MLTDAQCKAAKARDKAYKLSDAHGLRLDVSKTGHRSWRHKYRYGGKEKLRTLGTFPEVTLKQARDICKADKQLLKEGKDPITEAKRAVLAQQVAAKDTFEDLAREWYAKQQPRWKPVHAADVIKSLERDIFADLGSLPVRSIDSALVLATLQKVEARGAIETAHRLRQRISSIYDYGIAIGRAVTNPAASLVKVLKAKPPSRRWPAVTKIGNPRRSASRLALESLLPVIPAICLMLT
ncbi:tyrosine-type recombinase/integrase [Sphingomonas aracearum]|uniref:DUF4102 domain-containing protein n=1 Tax=Sphingomonas aracearum TaxID=2283317 RepID=A0A369VRE6_9SPHN|nr:integrase arm-type DNA-binding domain-containing protein [Sphingomonas aracearum]RDE04956.1 DUF4102 domain-containing protein [Sphingomonas aracearum]